MVYVTAQDSCCVRMVLEGPCVPQSRHGNVAMVRVSSILGWSSEQNWSHKLCSWRNHDLAAKRMDLSRMGGF